MSMPDDRFLPRASLPQQLAAFEMANYRNLGRQVRDRAIGCDRLPSIDDLPRATACFDFELPELDDGFLVEVGNESGQFVAVSLPLEPASADQPRAVEVGVAAVARPQARRLPPGSLRDARFAWLDHLRWRMVAESCLAGGICTSVYTRWSRRARCDETDIDGRDGHAVREWILCLTVQVSNVHGLTVHTGRGERRRRWLTHKSGEGMTSSGAAAVSDAGDALPGSRLASTTMKTSPPWSASLQGRHESR